MKFQSCALVALLSIISQAACNTDPGITGASGGTSGSSAGGKSGSGAGGTMGKPPTAPGSGTGGATAGSGGTGGSPPPATGFTPANIGGYKLGPPVTTDMPGAASN